MYNNIGNFMNVFGKIIIVVGALIAIILALISGGEGEGILISLAIIVVSILSGAGFYAVSYTIELLEKNNEYLKTIAANSNGVEHTDTDENAPNVDSTVVEETEGTKETSIVALEPSAKRVVVKKSRE